jgi:non-ribosomal peptide synthetase component E (peptide arylation enzyme)
VDLPIAIDGVGGHVIRRHPLQLGRVQRDLGHVVANVLGELLLDLDQLGPDRPDLLLVGRRQLDARSTHVAASELDQLYQSFPGFLDAACFVLPDPIVGDRIFAAIVPRPNEPIWLDALHKFLEEREVAHYKFPDKLLVVKQIPRDAGGRLLREQILKQV